MLYRIAGKAVDGFRKFHFICTLKTLYRFIRKRVFVDTGGFNVKLF